MSNFTLLCLISLLCLPWTPLIYGYYPPQQIHIECGRTPDNMCFEWVTEDYPIRTNSIMILGKHPILNSTNSIIYNGTTRLWTDPQAPLHSNRSMHLVNITGLQASTTYHYQVGDARYGLSSIYSFKTQSNGDTLSQHLPIRYAIFGDLGHVNAQILPKLTEEVLSDNIDVVYHLGDMAYQDKDDNSVNGDYYMNDISVVATHVPYMTLPGNCENAYNFSHFSERFWGLPFNMDYATIWSGSGASPNNWFYTWNNGYIHWISISTEVYFGLPHMVPIQYEWLIADLKQANKNRTLAPWIIVTGHRPFYCDNIEKGNRSRIDPECINDTAKVKDGFMVNGTLMYGLEQLFYQYGVDFYLCGHMHNYERMYDIYKNESTLSTKNMRSTTYIVSGSAGCFEKHDIFSDDIQFDWVAFRTEAYSYTKFDVYNETHIHLQQIAANISIAPQDNVVIDETWYIQEKHGPFAKHYPHP